MTRRYIGLILLIAAVVTAMEFLFAWMLKRVGVC